MVLIDVLTHARTLFLLQVFRGDYFGPVHPNLASSARGVPTSLSDAAFAFVTAVCWVHVASVEVWRCRVYLMLVAVPCVYDVKGSWVYVHVLMQVRCVSPPGAGADVVWTLTVAGVTSGPASNTTDYRAPVVSTVVVDTATSGPFKHLVPTQGGVSVVLSGTSLGPSAGLVAVYWDGRRLDSVNMAVCVGYAMELLRNDPFEASFALHRICWRVRAFLCACVPLAHACGRSSASCVCAVTGAPLLSGVRVPRGCGTTCEPVPGGGWRGGGPGLGR